MRGGSHIPVPKIGSSLIKIPYQVEERELTEMNDKNEGNSRSASQRNHANKRYNLTGETGFIGPNNSCAFIDSVSQSEGSWVSSQTLTPVSSTASKAAHGP